LVRMTHTRTLWLSGFLSETLFTSRLATNT
jgi:hypothetical protein